ncbi:MAG: hypothetical protein OHK0046_47670 [Anaerolineae bacterium]
MTEQILTPKRGLGLVAAASPTAILTIYEHAVMLKKQTAVGGGWVEYPVDPEEIAKAFATKVKLSTGLLNPNVLSVGIQGDFTVIVQFFPAHKAGIWIEGYDKAITVPLPPIVMLRRANGHRLPAYSFYAVRQRPESLDEPLFMAPLPNVSTDGSCWGTVPHPQKLTNNLEQDWMMFMGSKFGNHQVANKSRAYPGDIRIAYNAYEGRNEWPIDDLIQTKHTIDWLIS